LKYEEPIENASVLVMECCDRSLDDYLNDCLLNRKSDIENIVRGLFTQICEGLKYMRDRGVMHRDIKPGNVLVSSFDPSLPKAICKIADFGTSRVLNGSAEDQAALQKGLGTPLYMAPEILGSNKTYTQSADVYSFGIMLAHIWNEKSPYSDLHFDTPWALANYVSSGNRPQIEEGCPQAYFQLMTQCWQADPSQRPSFQQCVEFLEQLNNLFAEQPEEPGFVHYTQKLE